MHIEAYTRIIINHPEIVEFLSENQDKKEIQTACERLLLEFIKTTKELMKQHASNEDHKRRVHHRYNEGCGYYEDVARPLVSDFKDTFE